MLRGDAVPCEVLPVAAVLWEAPHPASSAAVRLAPSTCRAPLFFLLASPPLFMDADNSPIAVPGPMVRSPDQSTTGINIPGISQPVGPVREGLAWRQCDLTRTWTGCLTA